MTTRITRLTVLPPGAPLFSEMATDVLIDDEAAGEFVVVSQEGRVGAGKISIDPAEWPALRDAIERMINECKGPAL